MLHEAADIFNKHAIRYQEQFMDVGRYAQSLGTFLDYLPNHARVLELSCGPGNLTRHLISKRADLDILATDIAPNMVELARINNPSATCDVLDCRHLENIAASYHGIVCGFGLPYLSEADVRQLITDCASHLETHGSVYLSFMEELPQCRSGIRTNSAGEQLYMHYHAAGFVERCLSDAGFTCLHTERIAPQSGNPNEDRDLILIARKTGIVFE